MPRSQSPLKKRPATHGTAENDASVGRRVSKRVPQIMQRLDNGKNGLGIFCRD